MKTMETYEGGTHELPWDRARAAAQPAVPHLVIAWSLDEPTRLGQIAALDRAACLGRGDARPEDPLPRLAFAKVRPFSRVEGGPLRGANISRLQLELTPVPEGIRFENKGRANVLVNGAVCASGMLGAGDVLEIENALVFLVVSRRQVPAPLDNFKKLDFAFGAPDAFGMVGESEQAWALRDTLAFAAASDKHVLIRGDTGAGKELAAKAVHGLSVRAPRPFVSRNAATMPEALLDAEVFGNAKNYPNPGMAERVGLVGEADTGSLFLDEIGELPENQQVHLLRVLDQGGEYQRLGDSKVRRSDFRFIAATNRSLDALKHDFLARFTQQVELPNLDDRREDLALLLDVMLSRIAAAHPTLAARFFDRRDGHAEPRIAPRLVVGLLRHAFPHNVRELERLVWMAMQTASADYLDLTPELEQEMRRSATVNTVRPQERASTDDDADTDEDGSPATPAPSVEAVRAALATAGGSRTRAAKMLGLRNRYALLRLLKKYGIDAETDAPT